MQVLFDNKGCIKKYNRVGDILREFFDVRLDYYGRRKRYLEGMLGAESLKLDNISRFILEKIEGKIVIGESVKSVALFEMDIFWGGIFKYVCHIAFLPLINEDCS